ncbi:PREDICTED: protein abnormal spindle [Dinoponera quadriceps]|uniref:Protein abnormal spindle n=1 Tax=Dinoponera quadriceps TaxID=609295 RepID=A0A6P3X4W2_DINQU|nr:PREDICTED: protein abnormal spindle [Dinoponera quadriceps]
MELFQSVDKQMRFTILLAPFQPMVRIELEAYLNTTVECYLDIKNPSDKILNVIITKVPDAKRQITLNTDKLEIPGQSSSTISIKWSPKEAGCWRDVLQLTDNRRIKYDIAIATTANINKERGQKKLSKKATSKLTVPSVPLTVNNRLCQDNVSLSVPSNSGQSLLISVNKQMKGGDLRRQNNSNKENILRKYHEVKIYTQDNNRSARPGHHGYHESTSILSEQHSNVWSDGSVLPQTLLPSSAPQEIRRATYVKEKKHYNGTTTIYECSEEVTEDVACVRDRTESNFSMLINELKLTTTDVVTVSPKLLKESAGFTERRRCSLNVEDAHEGAHEERNKTFNVDHRPFEISAISIPEIVLSPVPRPLEYCELSFKHDVNSLIASSPILQRARNDVSRTERSEYFVDSIDCSGRVDRDYFNCATILENDENAEETGGDVYIEISPPRKYHPKLCASPFNTWTGRVTKEKKLCNGRSAKGHQMFVPVAAKKSTKKNVPAIKITRTTLCTLREMKKCTLSTIREARPHTEEISIYEVFRPSPFTSSMTENPFLKNMANVFTEKWLSRQELVFTLWLNTVLSTPKDLRVNIDNMITDTIDKWQSRKNEGIDVNAPAATTSTSYQTTRKLDALRKDAYAMLHRADIAEVKSRVDRCVTEGMLYLRSDRDLHRDLSLQKDVLNVFLCYNPLWLRIGLEAVYNENIPLRNNNDLFGLTRFITERFFTNPQLTKTPGYHRADPNKKFLKALNQFMLKKFLLLVYFLDYAKQHKLIGHDPCLFRKQAAWKTSREILLRFSRDILAGVGDVTKVLRSYDYVLAHRQTYIDEYEYEVTDIRQDLRDGVRLCRLVELITGADGLTRQCRAPAISRLQKVHNVEVALDALHRADGVLADDVEPKDIAYGDRTKTLSLLWQIVHKIQAPRLDRAARAIQRWWRSRVWYVRVRNYLLVRRDHAATVIQRTWRLRHWKTKVTEEHASFLRAKEAATCLQRWWRRARESELVKNRRESEDKRRRAVLALQRKWRATLLMRSQRERYRDLKKAALMIQTRWRTKRAAELRRAELLRVREYAVARIQRWWRSSRLTRERRQWFLRCRRNTLLIQKTWRAYQARERRRRDACLSIQTWWRAASSSRRYRLQRASCVKLQRWWRERQWFLVQRRAVSLIESWYLRVKAGKAAREDYLRTRHAAMRVQTWWRAVLRAREERRRYQQLRQSAVVLQTRWRLRAEARRDRQRFLEKRAACVVLQSFWRMVQVRRRYERLRSCTIILQKRWHAMLRAREERRRYQQLRQSAVVLQTRWRLRAEARRDRQRFLEKRAACVVLQSFWRMIQVRRCYERLRSCTIILQRRRRAMLRACEERRRYQQLRRSAVVLQTRWRLRAEARRDRQRFLEKKAACVVLQSFCRMVQVRRCYERLRSCTIILQRRWRAVLAGRLARRKFEVTWARVVVVQTRWRTFVARKRFLRYRRAAIVIQSYYRMRLAVRRFDDVKRAALTIQAYWRRYRRQRIKAESLAQREDLALLILDIQKECEGSRADQEVADSSHVLPNSNYWQQTIDILRNCNNVGALLTCLSSLDTITKLSPTICVTLCQLNLVDEIYKTISQRNRSQPWMIVCQRACSILITLAKYPYTRKYIVKQEYALLLVKLLSDALKDKEVFLHCATLIWRLCQDEDYSKAMMARLDINWLLKNIQQKVSKATAISKLQKSKKLEKLYSSCEPDKSSTLQFTNMNAAILAIINRTNTCY